MSKPIFGPTETIVDEATGTVTFVEPNSITVLPMSSPLFTMTDKELDAAHERIYGKPAMLHGKPTTLFGIPIVEAKQ